MPRVLGKQRGDAPGTRRMKGPRVKGVVGILGALAVCERRELAFDLAIDDVRPVSLNADERCSSRSVERAVRIVPARPYRRVNLIVPWFLADRRLELGEPDAQSPRAAEQAGQIGRVHL